MVGPGVISTTMGESWISFDPAGVLAAFGRHENAGWNRHTIHISRRSSNDWSAPVVAPFSGSFEDRGARFSPDGRRLIFSSNRPRPGAATSAARRDFDLWIVEKEATNWSAPRLLAPPISSDDNDFHASIAGDGSIWFASSRPGGAGRSDIYVARGVASENPVVERMPAPVNRAPPSSRCGRYCGCRSRIERGGRGGRRVLVARRRGGRGVGRGIGGDGQPG